MPQIRMVLNRMAANMLDHAPSQELADRLILAVELAFQIHGHNDVAMTITTASYTKGEAPVQIELLYTAGTDEYGTGDIFDPSQEVKELAETNIRKQFLNFLKDFNIGELTPSIWIRPQYQSLFKPGVVEDRAE